MERLGIRIVEELEIDQIDGLRELTHTSAGEPSW